MSPAEPKKTRKPESLEAADFKSRHASFDLRNTLILENLPKPQAWVLDIGSNLGAVSNELAAHGNYCVGIEKFAKPAKTAATQGRAHTAFMCADVTPGLITSGPRWDAILLLSVLHRIYAYEGEAAMRAVLLACAAKTDCLIIEGSTRHARYNDSGQTNPGFADLDVAAAALWHKTLFREVLPAAWVIADAIPLKCSAKEPYRLFFSLKRKTAAKTPAKTTAKTPAKTAAKSTAHAA